MLIAAFYVPIHCICDVVQETLKGEVMFPSNLNLSKNKHNTDSMLMTMLANLDNETLGHCRRVEVLAVSLGEKLQLSSAEVANLRLGSLLHDIGKKDIPEDVLNKKTPLTTEEWHLIQMHPVFGWKRVLAVELDDVVKGVILGHHLWANGCGGYPSCLRDLDPCLLTQITSVADVADAMISDRPYRPALSVTACLEYLEQNAGSKFNPEVVRAFAKLIRGDSIASGRTLK